MSNDKTQIEDAVQKALRELGDSVADENSWGGRIVEGVWMAAGVAISGAASFAFMYTYAPGLMAFVGPDLSPILSGVVGVLFMEGGALAWDYLKTYRAHTKEQQTIAGAMYWLDLVLAVAVTLVYLMLTTNLSIGMVEASGQLSQLARIVNFSGILIMTLCIAANFAGAASFSHYSATSLESAQNTALRAIATSAAHATKKATFIGIWAGAVEQLRALLPETTRTEGKRRAANIISAIDGRPAPAPATRQAPALMTAAPLDGAMPTLTPATPPTDAAGSFQSDNA